jgi:hypothetical protein
MTVTMTTAGFPSIGAVIATVSARRLVIALATGSVAKTAVSDDAPRRRVTREMWCHGCYRGGNVRACSITSSSPDIYAFVDISSSCRNASNTRRAKCAVLIHGPEASTGWECAATGDLDRHGRMAQRLVPPQTAVSRLKFLSLYSLRAVCLRSRAFGRVPTEIVRFARQFHVGT